MDRLIVHVDMDAFYASVEQLDNPEYRGKPVIVGADPQGGKGRGVVSASSYEAREFGIHSAMPISRAWKLCPDGIFLYPRFVRYAEISDVIMDILGEFSPVVEQISIDEAFMDCSGMERLFGPPPALGKKIKTRIFEITGLTASVGMAPNKSVAKIASDLHKPDGLTICESGHENSFLAPLPVKRLWGVGKRTVELLHKMGIKTAGDLAALPVEVLQGAFGKHGRHLWLMANGMDDREVCPEQGRKSYSEEITFEEDSDDEGLIEQVILGISDSLSRRLNRDGCSGRTVQIKIRLEGFETFTRSITLDWAVHRMNDIRRESVALYRKFDRGGKKVRLIGIGVSNLEYDSGSPRQLSLFDGNGNSFDVKNNISSSHTDKVLNDLKDRFGRKVTRATLLGSKRDRW